LPPALTTVAWSFMNNQSLTQEERRAFIAAGSKLRSRLRLARTFHPLRSAGLRPGVSQPIGRRRNGDWRSALQAFQGEYEKSRLGQSDPLNSQHYSIRRDDSTPAAQRSPDAKSSSDPLQTKGISRSTSDHCRTTAGPLPKQHACNMRRAGNNPRQCASAWEGGVAMKVKERVRP
jgi:hypothetical protein